MPIPVSILNDLCSRFILNIPSAQMNDIICVFFQIELAHWFYLDFLCKDDSTLTTYSFLEFALIVTEHLPNFDLSPDTVKNVIKMWKDYKMSIPTYGAIIIDKSMRYVLLVQGFNSNRCWGFPKGKINQMESPHRCAIREVREEIGFDISDMIDHERYLEIKFVNQMNRLYMIYDVSLDTTFRSQTRNEIKMVSWFKISALPANRKDMSCRNKLNMNANHFFLVIPFINRLKKWIVNNKQLSTIENISNPHFFMNGHLNYIIPALDTSEKIEKEFRILANENSLTDKSDTSSESAIIPLEQSASSSDIDLNSAVAATAISIPLSQPRSSKDLRSWVESVGKALHSHSPNAHIGNSDNVNQNSVQYPVFKLNSNPLCKAILLPSCNRLMSPDEFIDEEYSSSTIDDDEAKKPEKKKQSNASDVPKSNENYAVSHLRPTTSIDANTTAIKSKKTSLDFKVEEKIAFVSPTPNKENLPHHTRSRRNRRTFAKLSNHQRVCSSSSSSSLSACSKFSIPTFASSVQDIFLSVSHLPNSVYHLSNMKPDDYLTTDNTPDSNGDHFKVHSTPVSSPIKFSPPAFHPEPQLLDESTSKSSIFEVSQSESSLIEESSPGFTHSQEQSPSDTSLSEKESPPESPLSEEDSRLLCPFRRSLAMFSNELVTTHTSLGNISNSVPVHCLPDHFPPSYPPPGYSSPSSIDADNKTTTQLTRTMNFDQRLVYDPATTPQTVPDWFRSRPFPPTTSTHDLENIRSSGVNSHMFVPSQVRIPISVSPNPVAVGLAARKPIEEPGKQQYKYFNGKSTQKVNSGTTNQNLYFNGQNPQPKQCNIQPPHNLKFNYQDPQNEIFDVMPPRSVNFKTQPSLHAHHIAIPANIGNHSNVQPTTVKVRPLLPATLRVQPLCRQLSAPARPNRSRRLAANISGPIDEPLSPDGSPLANRNSIRVDPLKSHFIPISVAPSSSEVCVTCVSPVINTPTAQYADEYMLPAYIYTPEHRSSAQQFYSQ